MKPSARRSLEKVLGLVMQAQEAAEGKKPRYFKTTDEMLRWALKQKGKKNIPAPETERKGDTTDSELPETFGRIFADVVEGLCTPPPQNAHNWRGEGCKNYDDSRDVCLDDVPGCEDEKPVARASIEMKDIQDSQRGMMRFEDEPGQRSSPANTYYGKVLNEAADISAKLNDLADEAAKLGHAKGIDGNERERLHVFRKQIERADAAILDIGIGIV